MGDVMPVSKIRAALAAGGIIAVAAGAVLSSNAPETAQAPAPPADMPDTAAPAQAQEEPVAAIGLSPPGIAGYGAGAGSVPKGNREVKNPLSALSAKQIETQGALFGNLTGLKDIIRKKDAAPGDIVTKDAPLTAAVTPPPVADIYYDAEEQVDIGEIFTVKALVGKVDNADIYFSDTLEPGESAERGTVIYSQVMKACLQAPETAFSVTEPCRTQTAYNGAPLIWSWQAEALKGGKHKLLIKVFNIYGENENEANSQAFDIEVTVGLLGGIDGANTLIEKLTVLFDNLKGLIAAGIGVLAALGIGGNIIRKKKKAKAAEDGKHNGEQQPPAAA